jgi:hyperosmotically inducible periplasmic protein
MNASRIAVAALLLAASGWAQDRGTERLAKEVRHEIVMLPYYSLYDNLMFRVDGGTVTLMGQVVKPSLKSDAENVVRKIEGVERVVNEIEVLPNSMNDDRLRRQVYRAVFGASGLSRYAMSAVPSIHIIVKNGAVTLEGVTATESDKNFAYLRARGVHGAFSVTNHLQVEK